MNFYTVAVFSLALFSYSCKKSADSKSQIKSGSSYPAEHWKLEGECLGHLAIANGYTKSNFLSHRASAVARINSGIQLFWSAREFEEKSKAAKQSWWAQVAAIPTIPVSHLMDNLFVLGHFTPMFNAVSNMHSLKSLGGEKDSLAIKQMMKDFGSSLPSYSAKFKSMNAGKPVSPINVMSLLLSEKSGDPFSALGTAATISLVDAHIYMSETQRKQDGGRTSSSWLYPAMAVRGLTVGGDPVGAAYHFYGMAYLNFTQGKRGQQITRGSQVFFEYMLTSSFTGKADWEDINADSGGENFGIGLRSVLADQTQFDAKKSTSFYANRCEHRLDKSQGSASSSSSCDLIEINEMVGEEAAISIAKRRVDSNSDDVEGTVSGILNPTSCKAQAALYSSRLLTNNPNAKAKYIVWKYGDEFGVEKARISAGGTCVRTVSKLGDLNCSGGFLRSPKVSDCHVGYRCPSLDDSRKLGLNIGECASTSTTTKVDITQDCILDSH